MAYDDWGTITNEGTTSRLDFARFYPYSSDVLWTALTDPADLLKWWGLAFVDLSENGIFVMRWLNDGPDGPVVMHARIVELETGTVMETLGKPHGRLRWELAAVEGGTLVRFSVRANIPSEFRYLTLAGWHFHLDALGAMLDGGTPELADMDKTHWESLYDGYITRV